MNHIPIRFCLIETACTGRVVAKPVKGRVPQGPIQLDKRGLDGADHVRAVRFEDHETAGEFVQLYSLYLFNIAAVFPDACVQFKGWSGGRIVRNSGLSPAFWNSLIPIPES